VGPQHATTDGRNLRRDRNREAVVEALLALYREGVAAPNADAIAARAGISVRSLYRYFDDVPALVRTAIARQQQRLAPLYALDIPPDLSFDDRTQLFVVARTRLLEGMGAVGRLARSMAATQPLVMAELTRIRRVLREQLADVFGPELGALPAPQRRAVVTAADVVCSWEAYDLMCHDQGLSPEEARAAMRVALVRLFGPGGE
jgi:AcrR family transcriptional regulator